MNNARPSSNPPKFQPAQIPGTFFRALTIRFLLREGLSFQNIMFFKLLLLFILVPVAEIYLFLTLGSRIGIVPTLAIIVLTAVLGAALTRSQGARAINRIRQAMAENRLPHEEALDGLFILLAGLVLLTPGFLTDMVGFLLLMPPARVIVRRRLTRYLKGKIRIIQSPSVPRDPHNNSKEGDYIDV